MIVLARAFDGRPLRRAVAGEGKRLVFLSNPASVDDSGVQPHAVGFPAEDVYLFDERLAEELEAQWAAIAKTDRVLWARATPYK